MFRKVFIANRGEIAVRVVRTLREMGITSVVGFSDADRDALFVLEADEAYHLGPSAAADSYLNMAALLEVSALSRAEAVHPGYGFLSENPAFADAVQEAGLTFIGPPPHAMRTMGDKVAARRVARDLGVPLVPGSSGPVTSIHAARDLAREIGFPLVVKASGGGGGRGIRLVRSDQELEAALAASRREAESHFKNPDIYLERYFEEPRHVEIQVLGDNHGRLVYLGERDCSIQRRHQKLIEESPSPAVDRDMRVRLGEMALRVAGSVGYSSAGTVEFLLAPDEQFYFLEMNTRIQVEHPVTEWVTGVDLVREMVLVAAGEPQTVAHSRDELYGHAIEVRINAEDPSADFHPTPTTITKYREPGGPGTRVDGGVYTGYTVPPHYDSLLSKVICWAPDRDGARRRTIRALREFEIEGPRTTIPFHLATLAHQTFIDGAATTAFLNHHGEEILQSVTPRALHRQPADTSDMVRGEGRDFEVEVDRQLYRVRVSEVRSRQKSEGKRRQDRTSTARRINSVDLASPMHGTVVGVKKQVGDGVALDEPVFVLEAMKMENEVRAHRSGTVTAILAHAGDTVETDQTLARIE